MSVCRLAIAMNYIDDSLVEEAIEYEVHNNKKQFHKWKIVRGVVACLAVVTFISLIGINKRMKSSYGLLPGHFHYGDQIYEFHGDVKYSLPKDFQYVGEVRKTEQDAEQKDPEDFVGNLDGYVYMSDQDSSMAYFRWRNWDEATDGKEPYLVLYVLEDK